MLCELNIYAYAWTVSFEFYAVLRCLSDWVALITVAGIELAIAELTNCVYAYEQEFYRNEVYSAHRMDQLDRPLRYELRIIDLPFVHCKNTMLHCQFRLTVSIHLLSYVRCKDLDASRTILTR